MDTKLEDRAAANFRPWADVFPYVNGVCRNNGMPALQPDRATLALAFVIGSDTPKGANRRYQGSGTRRTAESDAVPEGRAVAARRSGIVASIDIAVQRATGVAAGMCVAALGARAFSSRRGAQRSPASGFTAPSSKPRRSAA